MKISTKGRYALAIMLDLAMNNPEEYIALKDIATRQEISIKYLERLSKDDLLVIIKYGLRNSNAPEDVTVEDIFNIIGCKFIELK